VHIHFLDEASAELTAEVIMTESYGDVDRVPDRRAPRVMGRPLSHGRVARAGLGAGGAIEAAEARTVISLQKPGYSLPAA
jgi:hypothetical protein